MGLVIKIMGRPVVRISDEVARPNLDALDALVQMARNDGARVLLYQAPHRPGEKRFYHDRHEYDGFFVHLEKRCGRDGMRFINLRDLVAAEHWGMTNMGLPDVFHFTHVGHRKLGSAIDDLLAQEGE